MKPTMGAAIALWMGMAATTAQAATPAKCVTRDEATTLFAAILPDMLEGIGKSCTGSLPEKATLRAGLPPLLATYRAPADVAWPQAMAVFGKLAGASLKGVDPKLMRPLMGQIMASAIAEDIKPADCPSIDRVVALLAPLPPGNTSELVVLLAEIGMKNEKNPPFAVCKSDPGASADATTTIAPHK
ncbi:MAG: hypothetical protein J0J06_04950 [Sphingomonas sp.]|uniref:hypothetical protein n=1 Tax=Sphingomonas sp. TaxID=28214 RepID=UPI001AC26F35|nr:hypothetical protein [Sphingomonas sp.]MBN8814779.1 hypothetical protein [Sphingomonas sp.]